MMTITNLVSTEIDSKQLIENSYQKIKKGSKSFYFASLFLSPKIRRRAWYLYAWCRLSDDLVDSARSNAEAQAHLAMLNTELDQLFSESKLPLKETEASLALSGISELKNEVNLSVIYLKDLLRGYKMDLNGFVAKSQAELIEYCYCVAGTVGLMMCQVMEIKNPNAFAHAKDLGIAMQLTNIMRDIHEDFKLGRVYIPQEFFTLNHYSVSDLTLHTNHVYVKAARYLFELAEKYYQSGYVGLKYLPFRERVAIAIAAVTYRKIGLEVLRLGEKAWNSRTFTTLLQKLACAFEGIFLAMRHSFKN